MCYNNYMKYGILKDQAVRIFMLLSVFFFQFAQKIYEFKKPSMILFFEIENPYGIKVEKKQKQKVTYTNLFFCSPNMVLLDIFRAQSARSVM